MKKQCFDLWFRAELQYLQKNMSLGKGRERERQREREIEAEKIAFGYWKKIFSQITDDLKELEGEGGEGRGFLAILFSL